MTVEIKRAEEGGRTGSPPRPGGFMITDILSLTRRQERDQPSDRLAAGSPDCRDPPTECPTDLTVKRADPETADDSDGDVTDDPEPGERLKSAASAGEWTAGRSGPRRQRPWHSRSVSYCCCSVLQCTPV